MAKKKTFKDGLNPAMQFLSKPTNLSTQAEAQGEVPEEYYLNPALIEKKTRRVQALLKPSLYDLLKQKADKETGGSVNEALNQILEEALK